MLVSLPYPYCTRYTVSELLYTKKRTFEQILKPFRWNVFSVAAKPYHHDN